MRALMKKSVADGLTDGGDALHLKIERMKPFAADHLVLEIAADRAGRREPGDIRAALFRVGRIGALEIDRQRDFDRVDDPLRIGEREVERDLLPVGQAIGVGDRVASGRQRFRAGARSTASALPTSQIL